MVEKFENITLRLLREIREDVKVVKEDVSNLQRRSFAKRHETFEGPDD